MTTERTGREPLPCPFCGSCADQVTRGGVKRVSCSNFGCSASHSFWHPDEWNRRSARAAAMAGGGNEDE